MNFNIYKCVDGRFTYLAKTFGSQNKKFLLFSSDEELYVEVRESITLDETSKRLKITGLPELIKFNYLGVFNSEEEALNSL